MVTPFIFAWNNGFGHELVLCVDGHTLPAGDETSVILDTTEAEAYV